jgi:predicted DCC family thiol-disulfide oxidoreductase YuxK
VILLYDGVCGLCNDWVQFTLKRDPAGRIRFAPLQGPTAERILRRHGRDPRDLDTVYLVLHPDEPDETVLDKSRAILRVLDVLGGGWKILALARVLPRALLDFGYDFVARRRYRWFGRKDSCPIPTPEHRSRFLD